MDAMSSSLSHRTPPSSSRRRQITAPLLGSRLTVRCEAYGWDHGGGMVDESMLVLRKRIHDMKMAERNYEPPAEWSEWEKKYYTTYGSDICELLGLVQLLLLGTRPAVAAGVLAVVALSVPTSAVFVLHLLAHVISSHMS